MSETWEVTGRYFEACNCEAACPCIFLSPPTDGECTALLGWQVEHGVFDGIALDGLNVALAVYAPGHMAEVEWQAALYLDDRASEEQGRALGTIFSGQGGGHPERLASHIGEVLGAASAAISFETEGRRTSMTIAGIAEASVTPIDGQGDGDVSVTGHPLAVAPGFAAVVSRSERLHYQDHGLTWEFAERNGFTSPFSYAS